MTSRSLEFARNPAVPRPVLLPFRVPPAPHLPPGPGAAGPAGLDRPLGRRGRPLSASRLAWVLPALPGWQLAHDDRTLSRLYSFRTAGCAASFAARVLQLTTAEGALVRGALAKEGSFVRLTALVPEGGWHLAGLRFLADLDRGALERKERFP